MKKYTWTALLAMVVAVVLLLLSRPHGPEQNTTSPSDTSSVAQSWQPFREPSVRTVVIRHQATNLAPSNPSLSQIEIDLALSNAPAMVRDSLRELGVPPIPAPEGTPKIPLVSVMNGSLVTNYAHSVEVRGDKLLVRYFPNGPVLTYDTNGVVILSAVVSKGPSL